MLLSLFHRFRNVIIIVSHYQFLNYRDVTTEQLDKSEWQALQKSFHGFAKSYLVEWRSQIQIRQKKSNTLREGDVHTSKTIFLAKVILQIAGRE